MLIQWLVLLAVFIRDLYRESLETILNFFTETINRVRYCIPSSLYDLLAKLASMAELEWLVKSGKGQPPPAPTVIAIIAAGRDQEDLTIMPYLHILTW